MIKYLKVFVRELQCLFFYYLSFTTNLFIVFTNFYDNYNKSTSEVTYQNNRFYFQEIEVYFLLKIFYYQV